MLQGIDAGELDWLIGALLLTLAHRDPDGLLVIVQDDKVLPGVWTRVNGQLALFSAMIHDTRPPRTQVRVPDGTSATTQPGTLLAGLPKPQTYQCVILT